MLCVRSDSGKLVCPKGSSDVTQSRWASGVSIEIWPVRYWIMNVQRAVRTRDRVPVLVQVEKGGFLLVNNYVSIRLFFFFLDMRAEPKLYPCGMIAFVCRHL